MACRYNVCVLLKVVLVVLQCLCLYKVFPATKFLLLQSPKFVSLQSLCRCKVFVTAKFAPPYSLMDVSVQYLCRYKVFPATKFVSLQSLCRYKVCVAIKFVSPKYSLNPRDTMTRVQCQYGRLDLPYLILERLCPGLHTFYLR